MTGNAGQGSYVAAKAGLINLTQSLARLYSPHGITSNAVSPGLVGTDMASKELRTKAGRAKLAHYGLWVPHNYRSVAHPEPAVDRDDGTGDVAGVRAGQERNRRAGTENLAGIGYQQRLRRERWSAVRSYLHAYATSHESRWLAHVIAAALVAPDGRARRE